MGTHLHEMRLRMELESIGLSKEQAIKVAHAFRDRNYTVVENEYLHSIGELERGIGDVLQHMQAYRPDLMPKTEN